MSGNDMEWDQDQFGEPLKFPTLLDSAQIDSEMRRIEETDAAPSDLAGGRPPNPLEVIARRFPHIAARIQQFWSSRHNLDDYLSSVVYMKRDDRRGFPPDALAAILEVWEQHRASFQRRTETTCPWMIDPSMHKAFKKMEMEQSLRSGGITGAEAALLDAALTRDALDASS